MTQQKELRAATLRFGGATTNYQKGPSGKPSTATRQDAAAGASIVVAPSHPSPSIAFVWLTRGRVHLRRRRSFTLRPECSSPPGRVEVCSSSATRPRVRMPKFLHTTIFFPYLGAAPPHWASRAAWTPGARWRVCALSPGLVEFCGAASAGSRTNMASDIALRKTRPFDS